jgi:hypothetical protein
LLAACCHSSVGCCCCCGCCLVPFPLCPTHTLPSFHIPRRARYDFRSLAFLKSPPPSAQDRVLCTGQGAV